MELFLRYLISFLESVDFKFGLVFGLKWIKSFLFEIRKPAALVQSLDMSMLVLL